MRFIIPEEISFKDAADFLREFYGGGRLSGSALIDGLAGGSTFNEWFDAVTSKEVCGVPSQTLFCAREEDGRIVGMANLRITEKPYPNRGETGDVGFCVRPSERGKGYGTEILSGALLICRMAGIRRAVLTCAAGNAASAAVIEKCGGILDAELYSGICGTNIRRYIIDSPGL